MQGTGRFAGTGVLVLVMSGFHNACTVNLVLPFQEGTQCRPLLLGFFVRFEEVRIVLSELLLFFLLVVRHPAILPAAGGREKETRVISIIYGAENLNFGADF